MTFLFLNTNFVPAFRALYLYRWLLHALFGAVRRYLQYLFMVDLANLMESILRSFSMAHMFGTKIFGTFVIS